MRLLLRYSVNFSLRQACYSMLLHQETVVVFLGPYILCKSLVRATELDKNPWPIVKDALSEKSHWASYFMGAGPICSQNLSCTKTWKSHLLTIVIIQYATEIIPQFGFGRLHPTTKLDHFFQRVGTEEVMLRPSRGRLKTICGKWQWQLQREV